MENDNFRETQTQLGNDGVLRAHQAQSNNREHLCIIMSYLNMLLIIKEAIGELHYI